MLAGLGCSRRSPDESRWSAKDVRAAAPQSAEVLPEARGKVVEACSDGSSAYARLDDGRVVGWGGGVSSLPYDRPVLIGVEPARQLDCAARCALLVDGRVQCWGQIGNVIAGSQFPAPGPHAPEERDVVEVRSVYNLRCHRRLDGGVRCKRGEQSFAPIEGVVDATALSVAQGRACARLPGGVVKCWGDVGPLGIRDAGRDSPPVVVSIDRLSPEESFALGQRGACRWLGARFDCSSTRTNGAAAPPVVAEVPNVVDVAGACALDTSGEVWCFEGKDRRDAGIRDGVKLAAGEVPCVIRRDGTLWCWGERSDASVLGRGDAIRTTPFAVPGIDDAVDLAAGPGSTCAVRASGEVACWGVIAEGRGVNKVAGIGDATRVVVGRHHACVLTRTGQVSCFGPPESNPVRLAGRGPGALVSGAPSLVPLSVRASHLALGDRFSCALGEDASVWCWGAGSLGQLGDGTTESSEAPRKVISLGRTKWLTAGEANACALDTDGLARCWGVEVHYSRSASEMPSPIPSRATLLDRAPSIRLATSHGGAALSTTGNVLPFVLLGESQGGEVEGGGGPWTLSATPVGPVALHDAVDFAGGSGHWCGRTKAGVVWCSGSNELGQLGDGSRRGRSEARAVPGLGAAEQLVSGDDHVCVRVGGRVFCWGSDRGNAVGARAWPVVAAAVAL